MADNFILIHLDPADNIAVLRAAAEAGTVLTPDGLTIRQDIPIGHKVAIRPIAQGEPILKYNTVIGYASQNISPGDHVHNHNIRFDTIKEVYHYCADYTPVPILPAQEQRTFLGYVRPNGLVGTRNCIAVTVCSNCAATVARKIANHFTPEILSAYPM